MGRSFGHSLRWVTVVHVAVLIVVLSFSLFSAQARRRTEVVIPVEFMVEVPASVAPTAIEPPQPNVPAPPKAPPKAPLETPSKRKPIKVSRRLVTRPNEGKPLTPALSEEEIRRLLEQGAKPADRTSIPSEDARCMETIRRRLYGLWSQPSYAEVRGAVAEVSLTFRPDGSIETSLLVRKSGNELLDESVQRMLQSLDLIEGLPSSFLQRRKTVSVSFLVEP